MSGERPQTAAATLTLVELRVLIKAHAEGLVGRIGSHEEFYRSRKTTETLSLYEHLHRIAHLGDLHDSLVAVADNDAEEAA